MQINLSDSHLGKSESAEIESLLKRQNPQLDNDLEQMWYLLDLVWDELGCDNRRLDWNRIIEYYSHPVWLLNGLFIEQDGESMIHRQAIAAYIKRIGASEVVDYGGGFGTLARTISEVNEHTNVYVYEPFPSEFGLKRIAEYQNITVIDRLRKNTGCLVSTDVLEHLDDPLKTLSHMTKSVKIGGVMLIAAPFFPMIKCHLPKHFHFRYTLRLFCWLMGARKTGTVPNATHVSIYRQVTHKQPNWFLIRGLVIASKALYPVAETIKPLVRLFTR